MPVEGHWNRQTAKQVFIVIHPMSGMGCFTLSSPMEFQGNTSIPTQVTSDCQCVGESPGLHPCPPSPDSAAVLTRRKVV